MALVADLLVLIVAAIHAYILVLEMFLWQTPPWLVVLLCALGGAALSAI